MSLATIIQDACRHPSLGLPVLTTVVGNTQSHAPLMLMAAKEELDSLAQRCNWQILTKENTFETTATSVQVTASAIPVDFDRMVNETIFNRTTRRMVYGPISAQDWQNIEASLVTMVDPCYRIRGGTILISPDPASGDTVAYEYISTYKVYSSGASTPDKATFTVDTDTTVFPEALVTLGVVWRYRRGRGYPYSNELEEYERRVVERILRDGSKPRLFTDAPVRIRSPRAPSTPETLTGLS